MSILDPCCRSAHAICCSIGPSSTFNSSITTTIALFSHAVVIQGAANQQTYLLDGSIQYFTYCRASLLVNMAVCTIQLSTMTLFIVSWLTIRRMYSRQVYTGLVPNIGAINTPSPQHLPLPAPYGKRLLLHFDAFIYQSRNQFLTSQLCNSKLPDVMTSLSKFRTCPGDYRLQPACETYDTFSRYKISFLHLPWSLVK